MRGKEERSSSDAIPCVMVKEEKIVKAVRDLWRQKRTWACDGKQVTSKRLEERGRRRAGEKNQRNSAQEAFKQSSVRTGGTRAGD